MSTSEGDFVLVVGAAHPDIFADYGADEADRIDKIGKLTYSVGGTAYNIAVNLARRYVDVALYTHLKEDSLFTDLILERLSASGVMTQFVRFDTNMPESGFLALREDGDLVSAVTASGITRVTLDEEGLVTAVDRAKIVVVDCNLSETQLELVGRITEDSGKSLFVAGVSESKAVRVHCLPTTVSLFSVNEYEARRAFDCEDLHPDTLRKKLRANDIEQLVVTEGVAGYLVVDETDVTRHTVPEVVDPISTSGAGDALLAGLCHVVNEHGELDWDVAPKRVNEYVKDVIVDEGSTVGATATERELSLPNRFNQPVQAFTDAPRWQQFWFVIGVISFLITIAGILLGFIDLSGLWSEFTRLATHLLG